MLYKKVKKFVQISKLTSLVIYSINKLILLQLLKWEAVAKFLENIIQLDGSLMVVGVLPKIVLYSRLRNQQL